MSGGRPQVGRTEKYTLQVPWQICWGLIVLAWVVAVANVAVNIRNGQQHSIDDAGWWLNTVMIGAISVAPVALASIGGFCWSGGRRAWATLAFVVAFPFLAFNLWNSSEYLGDQMLGKVMLSEMRQTDKKNNAEITNNELVRSKRKAEETLLEAYVATRDPGEKKRLGDKLNEIRAAPLALAATMPEVAAMAGARASWIARLMGWDKETVQGITPMSLPVLMQLAELFFSLLGFGLLPRKPQETASIPAQLYANNSNNSDKVDKWVGFPQAQARADLNQYIGSVDFTAYGTITFFARRWNWSPQRVRRFLSEQKDIKLPPPRKRSPRAVQSGENLIAMVATPNGKVHA